MAKRQHYISNKDLYAELVKYNEERDAAEGEIRVPEAVGKAILLITTRLASRGNFAAYSYKDEMISDAIENCLSAVNNFDVTKYKNPFAYFTQISWYAFIRRIDKEKRQSYLKIRNYKKQVAQEELDNSMSWGSAPVYVPNKGVDEVMDEFVKNYEKTLQRKKKKKEEQKGVDKFYTKD